MEIPVNKNLLASALTALGKLVSRTSLIKMYQAIQIEGRANTLFFRTRNVVEQIEFRMNADLEDDFPPVLVSFEQFRQVVRNNKSKTLNMEIENDEVFIGDVMLAPVKGRFPVPEIIPDQDVCVTDLPADTLSAMEKLAPIASKDDVRKVLKGINISRDGFTVANGKELSNIPFPLEMTGNVTIPFPLVLLATKALGEAGQLATWLKDGETHFELTLGNWTWRANAFKENYPNWKAVVPERKATTHHVSFQQDRAERLQRYLKSVPDDPKNFNGITLSRLPEVPDNLHLESSNGMLFSIVAEFDENWGDLLFTVRKENLLHLLNEGHTRIELNDEFGPFIGTGGMGQYIAMPIRLAKTRAENAQVEQTAPQPVPGTASQDEQNPPHKPENVIPAKPNTPSTKETPKMENTTPHAVSAPMQTFTPNQEPEKELNPLDELLANIEDMKAKSKALFDDSAAMVRKVREVALAQRQKEREYQQTKRTIERIRTASGF